MTLCPRPLTSLGTCTPRSGGPAGLHPDTAAPSPAWSAAPSVSGQQGAPESRRRAGGPGGRSGRRRRGPRRKGCAERDGVCGGGRVCGSGRRRKACAKARWTGCAEGDGVCDSGPRTPLPSGAADHAHTQGDPRRLHSASPGGAATSTGQRPRGGRNNPEKPAPRACRGRRLDRTHLSLTCTRPSSSCPACPARSAPSSGSAACATACCRRSSICFLSGSTVSWSFAENGCACEERPHR